MRGRLSRWPRDRQDLKEFLNLVHRADAAKRSTGVQAEKDPLHFVVNSSETFNLKEWGVEAGVGLW